MSQDQLRIGGGQAPRSPDVSSESGTPTQTAAASPPSCAHASDTSTDTWTPHAATLNTPRNHCAKDIFVASAMKGGLKRPPSIRIHGNPPLKTITPDIARESQRANVFF
ncbi:MAG: hypothetical protein R3C68_01110 [Myxococcota bacterium]